MSGHDELIERLATWGGARADVRAVLLIGSRARSDVPADRWSDLDVVLVTVDPRPYLDRADWLTELGEPWLTFLESTPSGGRTERRALFAGAVDADFVVVAAADLERMAEAGLPPDVADVLSRGHRFLVDKDGLAARIGRPARPSPEPPTEAAFANVVHDFWYHAVWVAKKLHRRELWTAQGGLSYMRWNGLLPMIVWHEKTRHGWSHETWHGGRFLERWAAPETVRELGRTFAHHEPADVERALRAAMDLFARVARETAAHLGHPYPRAAEDAVRAWIAESTAEAS